MLTEDDVRALARRKNTYKTAQSALRARVEPAWPLSYRLWLAITLIHARALRTANGLCFGRETAELRRWARARNRWVRRPAFQAAQKRVQKEVG